MNTLNSSTYSTRPPPRLARRPSSSLSLPDPPLWLSISTTVLVILGFGTAIIIYYSHFTPRSHLIDLSNRYGYSRVYQRLSSRRSPPSSKKKINSTQNPGRNFETSLEMQDLSSSPIKSTHHEPIPSNPRPSAEGGERTPLQDHPLLYTSCPTNHELGLQPYEPPQPPCMLSSSRDISTSVISDLRKCIDDETGGLRLNSEDDEEEEMETSSTVSVSSVESRIWFEDSEEEDEDRDGWWLLKRVDRGVDEAVRKVAGMGVGEGNEGGGERDPEEGLLVGVRDYEREEGEGEGEGEGEEEEEEEDQEGLDAGCVTMRLLRT